MRFERRPTMNCALYRSYCDRIYPAASPGHLAEPDHPDRERAILDRRAKKAAQPTVQAAGAAWTHLSLGSSARLLTRAKRSAGTAPCVLGRPRQNHLLRP